jgi:hypothetical protein
MPVLNRNPKSPAVPSPILGPSGRCHPDPPSDGKWLCEDTLRTVGKDVRAPGRGLGVREPRVPGIPEPCKGQSAENPKGWRKATSCLALPLHHAGLFLTYYLGRLCYF